MYAPQYGFGPNSQQQQQQPGSQPGYPNGGQPQQGQHPHQQPGQQMMYNPQAYPAGSHQSPYGTPGAGMGGNAGGMGMMQNSGLAQVPSGQMAQYQTPYTSSPYGASIPTSSSSNLPSNFMPTTSGGPSFQMNVSNMNPMQNRMQPPPSASNPAQRASPYSGIQQNTPPNAVPTSSQLSGPAANQPLNAQNNPQAHGTVVTPQTPSFPPGAQVGAGSNAGTPMSPGSESREKERVTLLLEINLALLSEASRLHTLQAAEKAKDPAADGAPKPASSILAALGKDYIECMKRLQSNLAYLAAIADRSHKPSSQIPSHPAVMSAPALVSKVVASGSDAAAEESTKENKEHIKKLYSNLQDLFPGASTAASATTPTAVKAKQEAEAKMAAMKADGDMGGETKGEEGFTKNHDGESGMGVGAE